MGSIPRLPFECAQTVIILKVQILGISDKMLRVLRRKCFHCSKTHDTKIHNFFSTKAPKKVCNKSFK